jgi:plasmid stabilization system protein ParE
MTPFKIAPSALADLEEIWTYNSTEIGDVVLADRIADDIFKAIRRISRFPELGYLRMDLAKDLCDFGKCGGI